MRPVVLISKDVLMPDYLPTYGNTFWKTPNIDEIASKGTVFMNHYTAAPSTGMSFTSMFTMKLPYQLDRTDYKPEPEYSGETLFDILADKGVSCHIIWSSNYLKAALPYSNCYRNAKIHTIDMNQPVGPYISDLPPIKRDNERANGIIDQIFELCKQIIKDDTFLWIHLPHVILGRESYGDDIDLLDSLVGKLRGIVDDDCFYITADHGNMNGRRGKWVYGFDVYQPAIKIPLISPRVNGTDKIMFNTCNTQLADLLLGNGIKRCEFIISDSAYYCQPNRSIAIIHGDYKLIFSKQRKTFELYDIMFDPDEQVDLYDLRPYDKERHRYTNVREVYYYPKWDQVEEAKKELQKKFDEIYRKGTFALEMKGRGKYILTQLLGKYLSRRNIKRKVNRK